MIKREFLILAAVSLLTGCGQIKGEGKKQEVVIYTAVEQEFCQPIFQEFEQQTGITVKAVYDTEANKTTGLVNRIIAEARQPVCDVFWNNEFIQTISLQDKGLLTPYQSEEAADIPDFYKDPEGYWTAIGGRARVILVNTDLLKPEEYPSSIYDFANGSCPGSDLALAYPAFGTTKTQVAAMYALLGKEKARELYEQIKASGVQIVDGNSVTKDMTVAGQVKAGYTDTDDAREAIGDEAHVEIVYPDQEEGGIGTLITPASLGLIANAPNEENGKKLIDFLVSRQSEQELIDSGFFDVSVREGESDNPAIRGMSLNLRQIYDMLDPAAKDMEEIFTIAN